MKKVISLALLLVTCLISTNIHAQEVKYLDVKIGQNYSLNQNVNISSKSNIYIIDNNYNKVSDLNTNNITVIYNGKSIDIKNNGKIIFSDFPKDGSLLLSSQDGLKIANSYRGHISFRIINNTLQVVNNVEIEDYLKGVVPKELSASYPKEALKAQAICSRSFALKNINKLKKYGYNLDDTTRCQVYGGKTIEDKRSNEAVEETKGIVAKYNNSIADTIFGASSGGYTANSSEVWGGKPVNYLSAFEDPYSTKYVWNYKISDNEIENKLAANKINIGKFLCFNVIEKDNSGRNKTIEIIGTEKTEKVSSNKFRTIFGNTKIKSTLFSIEDNGDSYTINGKGYGHGVGMSQYGAVEMAKQGKTYKDIISFYFPGVTLDE